MIKISFDSSDVLKKLNEKILAATDLRPVLLEIRGQAGNTNPMTVIGGIKTAFVSKGGSSVFSWPELTQPYASRKFKEFGAAPLLVRTGSLYKSLTEPGADGNVELFSWRKMVYGTAVPYAGFHQTGTSVMAQRRFANVSPDQLKRWKSLISAYITEGGKRGKVPAAG